jgi:catechol 2,3-dioxygenase-like lactoylglutathione lyase family enzyme
MSELGHVVFYVRDLAISVAFYRDIVGLDVKGGPHHRRHIRSHRQPEPVSPRSGRQRGRLFVDDPSVDWHADSEWMEAPVRPLALD